MCPEGEQSRQRAAERDLVQHEFYADLGALLKELTDRYKAEGRYLPLRGIPTLLVLQGVTSLSRGPYQDECMKRCDSGFVHLSSEFLVEMRQMENQ